MFTLQGMRGNVELITEKIRQEAIEEILEKFKEADKEILSYRRRFRDSKRFIQGTGTAGSRH